MRKPPFIFNLCSLVTGATLMILGGNLIPRGWETHDATMTFVTGPLICLLGACGAVGAVWSMAYVEDHRA